MSSSGIISKVLTDLGRIGNRETPAILNTLVIEDLAMASYLPIVAALIVAGTASTVSIAVVAVAIVLVLALRYGSGFSSMLAGNSDESLILAVFGLTLLVAGLAERIEMSGAIGARRCVRAAHRDRGTGHHPVRRPDPAPRSPTGTSRSPPGPRRGLTRPFSPDPHLVHAPPRTGSSIVTAWNRDLRRATAPRSIGRTCRAAHRCGINPGTRLQQVPSHRARPCRWHRRTPQPLGPKARTRPGPGERSRAQR